MTRLQTLARSLRLDRTGNAALIVALAVPALIGTSGLAVDAAQWYLWKRELQHSVDQAAYAGAWAMTREGTAGTRDRRAQQEYRANLKITKAFASQPVIRLASLEGSNNNSVFVSASATRTLPFSSFLTNQGVTVSLSAQASFRRGQNIRACLVTIDKFSIGGNSTVDAQCGLAAMSCEDDAFEVDGSATVHTKSLVACGKVSAPSDLNGAAPGGDSEEIVQEGIKDLKDPFAGLRPVIDTSKPQGECSKGKVKQATLTPGTYSSLVVKCTTVLKPGIYVIDGGVLDLTANYDVTGFGVQFVLRNGATMKLGGSGNGNKVILTPPKVGDLQYLPAAAAKAEELQGMLIIEEPYESLSRPQHILNGNSNSLIEGNIYLPSGDLRINGTADVKSQCLQITAFKITVLGNAVLKTFCPDNMTRSVGNAAPEVRLVR